MALSISLAPALTTFFSSLLARSVAYHRGVVGANDVLAVQLLQRFEVRFRVLDVVVLAGVDEYPIVARDALLCWPANLPTSLKGSSGAVSIEVDVAVEVLLHGVFDALARDQEHCAAAYVHAVVGDALQVVDHQGSPHPPTRVATAAF